MPTVRVNGCAIFYADDDFVDPWRTHDTVFLQPWLLGNHTRFRSWVPALAGDYRVIRMDRRGLGFSAAARPDEEITLEQTLADFAAVLDAVGIETVHYVGESTGGMFGIAFAATYPQRVSSLVLCATPASLAATAPAFAIDGVGDGPIAVMAMGSPDYARALATRAAQHASAEGALETHERWEHVARMEPHTIAAIIRMATDTRFDITALLPRIQAPTLLLTPGASEVLNADGQQTMSALIPQCEQVVFANAAHTIFFDYRQQCIDAARDFIGRHAHG